LRHLLPHAFARLSLTIHRSFFTEIISLPYILLYIHTDANATQIVWIEDVNGAGGTCFRNLLRPTTVICNIGACNALSMLLLLMLQYLQAPAGSLLGAQSYSDLDPADDQNQVLTVPLTALQFSRRRRSSGPQRVVASCLLFLLSPGAQI
jgi:hypothetical protein